MRQPAPQRRCLAVVGMTECGGAPMSLLRGPVLGVCDDDRRPRRRVGGGSQQVSRAVYVFDDAVGRQRMPIMADERTERQSAYCSVGDDEDVGRITRRGPTRQDLFQWMEHCLVKRPRHGLPVQRGFCRSGHVDASPRVWRGHLPVRVNQRVDGPRGPEWSEPDRASVDRRSGERAVPRLILGVAGAGLTIEPHVVDQDRSRRNTGDDVLRRRGQQVALDTDLRHVSAERYFQLSAFSLPVT
jgi:hypothetical protein